MPMILRKIRSGFGCRNGMFRAGCGAAIRSAFFAQAVEGGTGGLGRWRPGLSGAGVGDRGESFSIWTFQDGSVQLQFYSTSWDFGEGDTADLQVQIDRKPNWNLTKADLYRNSVLFNLPDSDAGGGIPVEVAQGNAALPAHRRWRRCAELFAVRFARLDRRADRMRQRDHAAGPWQIRSIRACVSRLALSIQIVTGPSLTSSTAMSAPKRPVSTGMPSAARQVCEGLVKALALLGRGGGGKSGAIAAQIGGQGELADHQRRPADIADRQVHLALRRP